MGDTMRGPPEDFKMNGGKRPSILKPFLDQVQSPMPARTESTPQSHLDPEKAVPSVQTHHSSHAQAISQVGDYPTDQRQASSESSAPSSKRKRPRFEISLDTDTRKMIRELVFMLQMKGDQRAPPRASDMMKALVALLYQSRSAINLSNVPPRGFPGSEQEEGFSKMLEDALRTALLSYLGGARRF